MAELYLAIDLEQFRSQLRYLKKNYEAMESNMLTI